MKTVPVVGIAAYSGSGKTSLLVKLLPLLRDRGLKVGVVKHAHHSFDIDHPGKDSYELRKAGASQMLIGSRQRWALMVETPDNENAQLADLIRHLETETLDLILVEGFKPADIPKIEVYRSALGNRPLHEQDPSFIAVATDDPANLGKDIPTLDLNQPALIANFIVERFVKRQAQQIVREV